MQLTPIELDHVLDIWPVARLASLGPREQPHIVPIVFAVDADAIYSPVDGKSKSTANLQRLRNIARQRTVALLLDHYEADWQALWWLRIDAEADVLDAAGLGRHARQRIERRLRSKYPQYDDVELFRDTPTLLRLRPTHHVAWSARTFDWLALTAAHGALDD